MELVTIGLLIGRSHPPRLSLPHLEVQNAEVLEGAAWEPPVALAALRWLKGQASRAIEGRPHGGDEARLALSHRGRHVAKLVAGQATCHRSSRPSQQRISTYGRSTNY